MKYRIVEMTAIQFRPNWRWGIIKPEDKVFIIQKYSGLFFKKWKNTDNGNFHLMLESAQERLLTLKGEHPAQLRMEEAKSYEQKVVYEDK